MTHKVTDLQVQILRDARDHADPLRFVFGFQERGGATLSLQSLQRRGLIRGNTITEAGRKIIDEIEPPLLSSKVREVLRDAGHAEYPRQDWGFAVQMSKTVEVAHVTYISPGDSTRREASVKFGNHEITCYVRALQEQGFRVSRINGVKSVDRLMVQPK